MLATSVSLRPHEPCLVDSVGHVLLLASISLTPTVFPPPPLQGFTVSEERDVMETFSLDTFSTKCLAASRRMCYNLIPEEASLLTRGTNI